MGVNDHQVGGDHYQCQYQHWDFIELNGLGYLEGCATKYVTRWRKRGGMQDLDKAVHYVEKLRVLHLAGHRLPRGHAASSEVQRFIEANDLTRNESQVISFLARWNCVADLTNALVYLSRLIAECHKMHEATGTGINPDEELTGESRREMDKKEPGHEQ